MEIDVSFFNKTDEDTSSYELLITKVLTEAAFLEQIDSKNFECSYIFVCNEMIKEMNYQYRDKNYVTDVLTFEAMDEGVNLLSGKNLGDVFLSLDKARSQAVEYGHSFEREVCFLAVHGFLHLLGYDHQIPEDELVMNARQEEILNAQGIRR